MVNRNASISHYDGKYTGRRGALHPNAGRFLTIIKEGQSVKINYNECSKFIKRELKIHLFPYQEVMLKAMCEGLEIRTARAIGRSFVADAFGKYVASVVSKNNYDKAPDMTFPYTCAISDGVLDEGQVELMRKECSQEVFEREMLCM